MSTMTSPIMITATVVDRYNSCRRYCYGYGLRLLATTYCYVHAETLKLGA